MSIGSRPVVSLHVDLARHQSRAEGDTPDDVHQRDRRRRCSRPRLRGHVCSDARMPVAPIRESKSPSPVDIPHSRSSQHEATGMKWRHANEGRGPAHDRPGPLRELRGAAAARPACRQPLLRTVQRRMAAGASGRPARDRLTRLRQLRGATAARPACGQPLLRKVQRGVAAGDGRAKVARAYRRQKRRCVTPLGLGTDSRW
jgi:hypothetical protein